jgi:hypothetical protein
MGTRDAIGRHLTVDDLPDRDAAMGWTDGKAPLFEALLTARDAMLCDAVAGHVEGDDPPRRVAVIYEAGHMGVLAHALGDVGFRVVESEWMTVFGS